MPTLYIDEAGKTSVYEVLEDEVTIGRGAANGIQLRDTRTSKHHAVIRRLQGRWKFVDLESKNGTRVNGAFRNQHWLVHGDTVTVGQAVLRVDLSEAGVSPTAATAAGPASKPVPPRAVAPTPVTPTPVAPKAVAPTPVAPKPVAPKPVAPRPVAPKAATPRAAAAPQARRAAPVRAAPARRPARDVDAYDDDEPQRPVRKKGMDSSVIVLVGGIAAVVIVLLFFLVMSPSTTQNKEVWLKANELAAPPGNDYTAALSYAERNGRPGEEDWDRLAEDMQKWREFKVEEERRVRDEAADKWLMDNVTRRTRTSGFSPKNALPDAEVAVLLKGFLEEYGDTRPADWILSSRPGEPWTTFQTILRNYASSDVDVGQLLAQARIKADGMAGGGRWGDAINVYDDLERTQRVLIDGELYRTLVRESTKRKNELLLDARSAFERDMSQVRTSAKIGEVRKARARLQVMIDTYGVPDLIREAQDEMEDLR